MDRTRFDTWLCAATGPAGKDGQGRMPWQRLG